MNLQEWIKALPGLKLNPNPLFDQCRNLLYELAQEKHPSWNCQELGIAFSALSARAFINKPTVPANPNGPHFSIIMPDNETFALWFSGINTGQQEELMLHFESEGLEHKRVGRMYIKPKNNNTLGLRMPSFN